MTRLSPSDEKRHAYLSFDLQPIGIVLFILSAFLTVLALMNVNAVIEPWQGNNLTFTRELRSNIKVFENGSYYYNYTDSETGLYNVGTIGSWFKNIIIGKYRYDYGSSFENFCWNRVEIPEDEYMPSLFRATQLFVSVQVPLRAAVLITITHRLFALYTSIKCKYVQKRKILILLAWPIFILNESIHLTSLFFYYALHICQDSIISYFIEMIAAVLLITSVVKMFTMSVIETGVGRCMIRSAFGVITVVIANNIFLNVHSYVTSMNCDQMVSPLIAISEYLFLTIILISYATDIIGTNSLELIVTCYPQELIDYEKTRT